MNLVGKKLEALKSALVLDWGELAEHLGISRSGMDFLRKGLRQPSPKMLRKIAEAEISAGIAQPTPPPAPILQEVQALDDLPGKVPNLGKACLYPSECDLPAKLDEIRREMAEARAERAELKSLLTDLLADGGLEALKRQQGRSKRAG